MVGEAKRGGMLREEFPDEYIVLSLSGKLFSYISFSIAEKDGMERTCTSGRIRAYLADSFAQEFLAEQRKIWRTGVDGGLADILILQVKEKRNGKKKKFIAVTEIVA